MLLIYTQYLLIVFDQEKIRKSIYGKCLLHAKPHFIILPICLHASILLIKWKRIPTITVIDYISFL